MTDTDIDSKGGADDLGGHPNRRVGDTEKSQADRLTDEKIRKQRLSRTLSISLVITMLVMAVACSIFALYTGYHFLETLDRSQKKSDMEVAISVVQQIYEKQGSPISACTGCQNTKPAEAASSGDEIKISSFAALIPATFSSALAIILFITLARFVTNFGLSEREDEKVQDYGAISALVQEIISVFKSFKEK